MAVSGVHPALIAILVLSVTIISCVSSAPPPPQQQQQQPQLQKLQKEVPSKLIGKSFEKTADLTLLINETLRINNKLVPENVASNQSFRDDWTFDRVEYDLMDFLQELNARYQYTNRSSASEPAELAEQSAPPALSEPIDKTFESKREAAANSTAANSTSAEQRQVSTKSEDRPGLPVTSDVVQQSANSSAAAAKEGLAAGTTDKLSTAANDGVEKADAAQKPQQQTTAAAAAPSSPLGATSSPLSVLPISLATGDHDISESTWQYGIFDRFTRPRAAATTPQPADSVGLSSSGGASLDVRSFNTDECGLRAYRQEPDYFPDSGQLDTDEIAKELSQRRQRPPLGSSFFQSHKKYHHTAAGDPALAIDREPTRGELDQRDKLLPPPPPPFDRYGEPMLPPGDDAASAPFHHNRSNYSSIVDGAGPGQSEAHFAPHSPHSDSSSLSAGDGEFNLSSRRQWLQQQLGSTLQMLGFNSTNQAALDYFINQTTGASAAMGGRENMMKMSAANKLGKALGRDRDRDHHQHHQHEKAVDVDPSSLSGPEVSEQELKARQDDLKLEARVIGGNDARLGDSPWSVSLQALVSRPGTGGLEYRHYCGGTIISEYYILTAAHCLDFMVGRESRLFVVVGDLNWRMSTASLHGRRFGIEKLIIHSGYKSTAFGHDIGLIRTKESMKPLKVNGRYIINSVCLPERNAEHSGEAELVGWGLFSNRNEMADSLQIADVPILPRPLCVDLYRRRTGLIQWLIGIELITEKQVCAGTFGRGICQGDSGSALVFNEKVHPDGKAAHNTRLKAHIARDAQQRATIIGIVAFGGIRRCSYQSLPGVYMQTSKYLDWILPRIQNS